LGNLFQIETLARASKRKVLDHRFISRHIGRAGQAKRDNQISPLTSPK